MHYLQSAGTIQNHHSNGNGLTEADTTGMSRFDFVASSSLPYRATLANRHEEHQSQIQLHQQLFQMKTSGKKLLPSGSLQPYLPPYS